MAKRQTYTITPDTPARSFALDWTPATLSIINTSSYPVYLFIGTQSTPSINDHTGVVPAYSSYVAATGGAHEFGIFVDHAGDTTANYAFPITVTFNESAGEVAAPLSGAFPAGQPISTLTRYTYQYNPFNSTEIAFGRTDYDVRSPITLSSSRLAYSRRMILNVSVNIPVSISVDMSAVNLTLKRYSWPAGTGSEIVVTHIIPFQGGALSILINRIITLEANWGLGLFLDWTGTSLTIEAGGTLSCKQLA
jgi:hypothetical protein